MTGPFEKPFEANILSHALRATPKWPDPADRDRYAVCELFCRALRKLRIADAKFTLSIDEGAPGPERQAALSAQRFAQQRVCETYLVARSHGVVTEGRTPQFLAREDAALITTACGQYRLHMEEEGDYSPFEIEAVSALENLFDQAVKDGMDIFVR